MRNGAILRRSLLIAGCMLACALCTKTEAAEDAAPKKRTPSTVAQLIDSIDGKPLGIGLNYGPGTTFVEMHLWGYRDQYVAERKDEQALLAAMRDEKRSIERRLCVASFLLDLKNDEARTFVVKCLDGEQGETAQNNAPFILVSTDNGAEQNWRQKQILRLIERGGVTRGWDSICYRAGELKLQEAVEPLIQVLRAQPNDRSAAIALGDIGDKRATPVLLETIERNGRIHEGQMYALRDLGAPELPSILLRHLDEYECIDLLAYLDAKQAIEPLKKLLADPDSQYKDHARIAFARLSAVDKKDLAERLLQIADSDPKASWSAIKHVGPTGQRWAVPTLLKIAKSSNHDLVIWSCIDALGELGGEEAIAGLLALFDHDFSKVPPSKTDFEANPHIIMALKEATGNDFGKDPQAWKQALK